MNTISLWRRGFKGDLITIAVMVTLAVICFHFMPSNLSFFTRIIAIMLLVLAIDLVTGFTGIATLGHAALYGAGAYAAGIAAAKFGINDPVLMLLVGIVAGALMGLLSSLVILRGHGLSQLVLSIAVVQLAREAANRFSTWTGGSDGLAGISPAPLFGMWRFDLWGRTWSHILLAGRRAADRHVHYSAPDHPLALWQAVPSHPPRPGAGARHGRPRLSDASKNVCHLGRGRGPWRRAFGGGGARGQGRRPRQPVV
ncbi:inner-membrane translocator (plasmid) [Ketogulonicigenium vulgare Y25]|nr:inner-membrane translocator [Ketogulonicigenium vulgare Y25]